MKTPLILLFALLFYSAISQTQSMKMLQPKGLELWQKIKAFNQHGRKNLFKHSQNQMKSLDSFIVNMSNTNYFFKFQYDGQGNEILEEMNKIVNGNMTYGEKLAFFYDTQDLLTQIIEKQYDNNNQIWQLYKKTDISYNAQNSIDEILIYSYDDVTGSWDEEEKYQFQYDTNNLLSMYTEQTYNNGNWENYMKREITYTATGKYALINDYEWDNGQWMKTREESFDYDPVSDMMTNRTVFSGSNNILNPWKKISYSYDANNNQTEEIHYIWDEINALWTPDEKGTISYTANQSIDEHIYYTYHSSSSSWESLNKEIYTYDDNYTYNDLVLPYYFLNGMKMFLLISMIGLWICPLFSSINYPW